MTGEQCLNREPEPQIMDFKTQQYKLYPNIATVYCFRMVADWLWTLYNNVTAELEGGTLDRLPEVIGLNITLY